MLKIGDVFKITLSDGRHAYGQYVYKDKMGPMIRVFDIRTEVDIDINRLRNAKLLFPPILTGLFAAIRNSYWKKIGHIPVELFIYPNFVSTLFNYQTGKAGVWFLWNGERDIKLGNKLPKEYKTLEFLIVWDPHDVVRRIETGEYPYPYKELILYNEFTPKKE